MTATRVCRSALVAGVAAIAALGSAGPARAARAAVSGTGGTVDYVAGPAETNDLRASVAGTTVTLVDAGATIAAEPPCQAVDARTVRCPGTALSAALADGADTATVTGALPAHADGGAGADILTGDGTASLTSPKTPNITIIATSGSAYNDVFVFHAGEAQGDLVTDFYGAGRYAGDRLEFDGYGAGTIAQVGSTDSYAITADAAHGGITETIRLAGVFDLDTHVGSNDFLFV
jgi:hypothetical protein